MHHHRWVTSKSSNNAGQRLGREWQVLLGPFHSLFGRWFARRQIKRLPYLFSVADNLDNFPNTEKLIEGISAEWLQALETILSQQPYIFGDRASLADFAHYGQLAMNLDDPCAANLIKTSSPNTFAWLQRIRNGNIHSSGDFNYSSKRLAPLIKLLNKYYLPLMQQNFAAYEKYRSQGKTRFNEAAFKRKQCLYDGLLVGMPFRSVAKSFQAKVWRNNIRQWHNLSATDQQNISDFGVNTEYFN